MAMDDKERQTAFMSALVTEHFVLQTAANATVSEAAASLPSHEELRP
jgi:hypothetical protein